MSMLATTSSTRRACRQAAARHQHRHAHRLLVGGALVDQAVLAEREAVVAHEDDERRVEQPALAQQRDDAADAVVDGEQRLGVAPVVLGDVERAVVREVHAVPAVALVPHPHRLAGVDSPAYRPSSSAA